MLIGLSLGAGTVSAQNVEQFQKSWVNGLDAIAKEHQAVDDERPAQYIIALGELKARLQKTGNLDNTLAVKNELVRFEEARKVGKSDRVDSPPELRRLQDTWIDLGVGDRLARAKKVKRLALQYQRGLAALEKSLTVDGKLDEALAVRAIKRSVSDYPEVKAAGFVLAELASVDVQPKTTVRASTIHPAPSAFDEKKDLVFHLGFNSGSSLFRESVSGKQAQAREVSGKRDSARGSVAEYTDKRSAVRLSDALLPALFPGQSGGAGKDFSVSAWVNITAGDRRNPIAGKQGHNKRGFMFSVEPNNKLTIELFSTPDKKTQVQAGPSLELNEWTHVAATYDFDGDGRSRTVLYVNGRQVAVEPACVGPVLASDVQFYAGRYDWGSSYAVSLHGKLDDLRVYSSVLTALEVAALRKIKQ